MSWTELEIQSAWDKGYLVERFDPRKWRKDACGAWISREQYGNRNSRFGWEVVCPPPATPGEAVNPSRLQPLQWKNAASNQNGNPRCLVQAYGGENLDLS
jgi:hypothetical protein